MKVVKGKKQLSDPDGIIMANGVVLKDSQHKFDADKDLVLESLSYVAKISKGLYSGICNGDSEFSKFQKESIDNLLEKETKKLCENSIIGADKQLQRVLSGNRAEVGTNYIFSGRKSNDTVEHIDLSDAEPVKDKSKRPTHFSQMQDIIEKTGDKLASFNNEELEYIKCVNEASEEIDKATKKILDKTIKKRMKKKVVKKEAVKKTMKKKVVKKNKVKKSDRK